MVRVKRGKRGRRRHKKVLNRAKGFRGSLRKLYRASKQAVTHAMKYSTRDRKTRKREMRRLWITRIGIAAVALGISYSKLINALKKKKVGLNRKSLADLAVFDPSAFKKLVAVIKSFSK